MGDLFLGLDLSTQQLKCVLIDSNHKLIHSEAILFDDLGYGTTMGFLDFGNGEITAPTMMFVAALDKLLSTLDSGLLSRVKAISASGQQHGTVYWRNGASKTLENLDSSKSLKEQLGNAFSLANSPIWMDSSTKTNCIALTNFVGGPEKLSNITGSSAYERFSIHQILKFAENPKLQTSGWAQTERVSLISSFVVSLLIGSYAPIDLSDGSGMNILDIKTKSWSADVLNFVDACENKTNKSQTEWKMAKKLGKPVEAATVIGNTTDYFKKRYGLSGQVIAATGDNPSSFAGLNIGPRDICLSLGTSDTVMMAMRDPKPQTEGHVFVNPVDADSYMGMLCYKNGSLIRQKIRDKYDLTWNEFGKILASTQPTKAIFICYEYEEITPILHGTWRYLLSGSEFIQVDKMERDVEIRSLIETQIIAKRAHAEKFGFEGGDKLIVTGGASANKEILQVIADIFQLSVYIQSETENSAAVGAANRALFGKLRSQDKISDTFNQVFSKSNSLELCATPNVDLAAHYAEITETYKKIENDLKSTVKL